MPARLPRQGLLGGVFVTLLAEGIALPAAVIAAMVLTRAFGPEVYGRFTVVATTVAMVEWLLIAVFARAVVKFVAEAEDWRPAAATSLRVYVLSGVTIGILLWVLADPIATALRDPSMAGYFRLFALQIPVFAVGASCRNVLSGQARYRQQAAASSVGWIGRVTFIVLFVQLGYGVEGAIVGSIGGTLVGSLMALLLVGWPGWRLPGVPARRLLQLALPAFLALLSTRLLDQVGLLSLKVLADGQAEVGYYGAAMNVTIVTSVIAAAIVPVLISTLTQARYGNDEGRVRQVANGALRFGLALFPFAAVVAGASAELVALLYGVDFAAAAPLMAALIVAAVARANVSVLGSMLIALNRAWVGAWLVLPLPFVAIVGHIVLIPRFGPLGAALVTMVLALAGTAGSVSVACWVVGIRLPVLTAARSLLLTGGAYAVAVNWPTPGPLVLVKVVVLSVGIVGGLLASGELSRQELVVLRRQLFGARVPAPRRD